MDSPTFTISATAAGTILGTAPYMSPEQARGKDVDKRADIWAFGVVLYELVVGDRPFKGNDFTEVLASVVKDTPDLTKVPVEVRRLLASCFEKDPKQRLRDIGDAWRLLEEPPAAPEGAPVLPWAVAAVLGLAAAIGWLRTGSVTAELPSVALTILPAPGTTLEEIGRNNAVPEIAPDGTGILYFAGGRYQVRRLDSLETEVVPGSETAGNPGFWSPDSITVLYPSRERQLRKVRMPDGAPQAIASTLGPSRGGSWSDAGTILFSSSPTAPFSLSTVSAAGGEFKTVEFPEPLKAAEITYPEFLPRSEDFLFFCNESPDADEGTVYLAALRDGRCVNPVPLLKNGTPARYTLAGGGRLLFVRNDNLYSQKLNRGSRALEGEATLVARGISSARRANFSVARNGTIAWRPGIAAWSQVTEFDRAGNVVATSGPKGPASDLRLSPDEKQLLVFVGAAIWLVDAGQTGRVELPRNVDWFGWFQGGSKLVGFKTGALVEMAASGSGETREIRKWQAGDLSSTPEASFDGKQFVGQIGDDLSAYQIEGTPAEIRPRTIMKGTSDFFGFQLSPSGRWILYESKQSGGGLYVAAFDGLGARLQIASAGGRAVWRGDGKEILYVSEGTIMSVPVEGTETLTFGAPRKLFSGLRLPGGVVASSTPLAVSRDGSRIFWAQGVEQPESNVIHVKTGAVR